MPTLVPHSQYIEFRSASSYVWCFKVTVEGTAPDEYLKRFKWNEAKYPPRRALKEMVATITETIQKLEDDLKVGPLYISWHHLCINPIIGV